MGEQQQLALVSMTNKDVYYLSELATSELGDLMQMGDDTFTFIDARSGAEITISIDKVSSLVKPKGEQRG